MHSGDHVIRIVGDSVWSQFQLNHVRVLIRGIRRRQVAFRAPTEFKILLQAQEKRGLLSKLYGMLLSNTTQKDKVKGKLEIDLRISITEEDWEI